MSEPSQTSKKYLDGLPIAVQQAFKLIKEREDWTAKDGEKLSMLFERLIAMPDYQVIILYSITHKREENIAFIIQVLAYLRIEQAVYFLKTMPTDFEEALLKEISAINDGRNDFLAERKNLVSRLETLLRLNMLNRVFSLDRRNFVLSVLQNAHESN